MEFDWSEAKAAANLRKHGVDFLEAMSLFADPLTVTDFDEEHSDGEDRFVSVGRAGSGRLLLVVHTFSEVVHAGEPPYSFVRLISAREPTAHERRCYEQGVN
ncbi:MAG: BrnT family toxin [Betaproteobacteria bacterium]|nr:MAG: BrnT family toxin [Betaproteobacteria bacterium]